MMIKPPLDFNPLKLRDTLIKATLQTYSVLSRPHVEKTRACRAGEFKTCVRRQIMISYQYNSLEKSQLLKLLAAPDSWDDVLEWQDHFFSYKIDRDNIQVVKDTINQVRFYMDTKSSEVLSLELDVMSNQVASTETTLKQAEAINKEAESILEGFSELLDSMSLQ